MKWIQKGALTLLVGHSASCVLFLFLLSILYLIVENPSFRGSESNSDTHIFSLAKIPIIEDRGELINTDRLLNKRFLVKGSNSIIHTAKLKGRQSVVIKQIRANIADNIIAEREFQIEHDMLSRIKYVMSFLSTLFLRILSSLAMHISCNISVEAIYRRNQEKRGF